MVDCPSAAGELREPVQREMVTSVTITVLQLVVVRLRLPHGQNPAMSNAWHGRGLHQSV